MPNRAAMPKLAPTAGSLAALTASLKATEKIGPPAREGIASITQTLLAGGRLGVDGYGGSQAATMGGVNSSFGRGPRQDFGTGLRSTADVAADVAFQFVGA